MKNISINGVEINYVHGFWDAMFDGMWVTARTPMLAYMKCLDGLVDELGSNKERVL